MNWAMVVVTLLSLAPEAETLSTKNGEQWITSRDEAMLKAPNGDEWRLTRTAGGTADNRNFEQWYVGVEKRYPDGWHLVSRFEQRAWRIDAKTMNRVWVVFSLDAKGVLQAVQHSSQRVEGKKPVDTEVLWQWNPVTGFKPTGP
ncbi:MAG: hypothetical protein Q8L48_05995 [Archangium sp.]|nr:hypothetical protein [Archangium sp.]